MHVGDLAIPTVDAFRGALCVVREHGLEQVPPAQLLHGVEGAVNGAPQHIVALLPPSRVRRRARCRLVGIELAEERPHAIGASMAAASDELVQAHPQCLELVLLCRGRPLPPGVLMRLSSQGQVAHVHGQHRVVAHPIPKPLERRHGVQAPSVRHQGFKQLLLLYDATQPHCDLLHVGGPTGVLGAQQRNLQAVTGLRREGAEEPVQAQPVMWIRMPGAVVGDPQQRLLVPARLLRRSAKDVQVDTAVAAVPPTLVHALHVHL
mmetsp:Transcript_74419/g.215704  ORF Transcript_74419/g.215704 Transcript_74419/m.215704 type:complete len:263 (+) Transcript_74419:649-1437(+)